MIPLTVHEDDIETARFCARCARLLGNRNYPDNADNWKCGATKQFTTYNLITGLPIVNASRCLDARTSEDLCGPSGKLYEEYIKPEIYNPRNLDDVPPQDPKPIKIKKKLSEEDLQNL